MEIGEFTFHRPSSLEGACELGRRFGTEGRYLAGGTELLVLLKQQRVSVRHIIALDSIPELRDIRHDGTFLRIGALASLSDIATSKTVRHWYLPLAEAALTMAGAQIRNRATIGGNFCAAVPCADTPPICIAGEAQVALVNPEGARTIPAEALFVGPRRTVLEAADVMTEILIPTQPAGSGASYHRFSRRGAMTLAVAGAAARLVVRDDRIIDVRIALASVAPLPMLTREAGRALIGQRPTEALLARAGRRAASEALPITDVRGSMEFRRSLVETMTVRALRCALGRSATAGRSS